MTDVPLPEGPAEQPSRQGGLLQRLQPLLTLLIAIVAIALAVWEGLENRRHNRLTVQPRLNASIDAGRNSDQEYVRMALESSGLGPAVLTRFVIYFDGVAQDTTMNTDTHPWANVIAGVEQDGMSINAQAYGMGSYIPSGEERVLFEATRQYDAAAPSLSDILDRIAVQVCYCSIYGTDCDGELLTTNPASGEVEPCER
ncbi:MAG TPA: hypothetical protein VF039_06635 [Longimicrobiales bacterium]